MNPSQIIICAQFLFVGIVLAVAGLLTSSEDEEHEESENPWREI